MNNIEYILMCVECFNIFYNKDEDEIVCNECKKEVE